MTEAKSCPRCGDLLPPDAPAGMCPKCLLAAAMAGDTDVRQRRSDEAPTTPLPHSSRFVPPPAEELAKHFPQLEILELIGAGGMGAVYKARQPGLDRLVAVKILPPEVGADPSFAQRFSREAQALARLGHQHIVSVYDFGVADGLYYFIMEYVDGANLRHLIKTGGLKPAEALAIVPQICEALQFAHDEGVVHRDIKPENILIDKRGRVKIADFGLARLLGTTAPEISLTGTNQVLGTLHYMAPEQIQGLRTVDHRADIYSLGVVFYEMLTGELPLGRFAPPSQKVELDVRLDEVVLRSLEAEPQRRYQQVSQVKNDVERISQDNASPAQSLPDVQTHTAPIPAAASSNTALPLQPAAVRGPATALLAVGALSLLSTALLPIISIVVRVDLHRSLADNGALLGFGPIELLVLLTSVVYGLLAIFGGLSMRHCRRYGLAVVAATVATLPLSIVWPLGLPIGIWSLIVLASPNVRAAFGTDETAPRKSPREQVHWPATFLIVVGLIDLAAFLYFAAYLVLSLLNKPAMHSTGVVPALAALALAFTIVRLGGDIQMLRLRTYRFVSIAAAVSILPGSMAALLGIPAGIWALAVLTRREVREAFGNGGQDEREVTPTRRGSADEPPRSPNNATNDEFKVDAEERERFLELSERQPGWLPFAQLAVFAAGWLFAGAMWNFGSIGFGIATIVLAALTYAAIRWTLVYLPKLQDELSRQSPLRRGFSLASGLILFALAMLLTMTTVCLIWGAFTFPRPDTDFAEQQAQLLDVLKSAKFLEVNEPFNVISVGPWTYRSRWEPLILAWVAITLAVGAVGAAIDTRRYRNSWRNSWIPTLSISAMLYAALIFLFIVFLPKGTRSVTPREVRCEATTNELTDVVKAWGRKNGYVVAERMTGIKGPAGSRALPPVPVPELKPEDLGPGPFGKNEVAVSKDGKNYIVKDGKVYRPVAEDFREAVEVVRYDLASPTPFDSYRTSWQGVYRPRPPLTVAFATKTVVGSERIDNVRGPETTRKNAFVRIAPAWEWLKTPESALWPPLLDDLETTLAAAGKVEHAKGDREAGK